MVEDRTCALGVDGLRALEPAQVGHQPGEAVFGFRPSTPFDEGLKKTIEPISKLRETCKKVVVRGTVSFETTSSRSMSEMTGEELRRDLKR